MPRTLKIVGAIFTCLVIGWIFSLRPSMPKQCAQRNLVHIKLGKDIYNIPKKFFTNLFISPDPGESASCGSKDVVFNARFFSFWPEDALPSYAIKGTHTFTPGMSFNYAPISIPNKFGPSDMFGPPDMFVLVQKKLKEKKIDLKKLPLKNGFYECDKCSFGARYDYFPMVYISSDSQVLTPNKYPIVFGCSRDTCSTWFRKGDVSINIGRIDRNRVPNEKFAEFYKAIFSLADSLVENKR